MSDTTDDLAEGVSCDLCGQYFDGGENEGCDFIAYSHGHPATCRECWSELTNPERKQHQLARVHTLG